jgi:hypothetical protein
LGWGSGNLRFITLLMLLWKVPIVSIVNAIEQSGIYTFDRFGRLIFAIEAEKEIAFDLLAQEHDWWTNPKGHQEFTMSPLETANAVKYSGDPDDTYTPYEDFGWPKDKLPNFNIENQPSIKQIPKSSGHLNHSKVWQARANELAASLTQQLKHKPTRNQVAKLLASELNMVEETVLRRIRKQW